MQDLTRFLIDQWIDWSNSIDYVYAGWLTFLIGSRPSAEAEGSIPAAQARFETLLGALDAHVQGRTWLVGSSLTLAVRLGWSQTFPTVCPPKKVSLFPSRGLCSYPTSPLPRAFPQDVVVAMSLHLSWLVLMDEEYRTRFPNATRLLQSVYDHPTTRKLSPVSAEHLSVDRLAALPSIFLAHSCATGLGPPPFLRPFPPY